MIVQTLILVGLAASQPPASTAANASSDEGRWRLTLTMPVVQNAPFLGDLERSFRMSALVDVTAGRDGLEQRTSACALSIEGGIAARVSVPDDFASAIDVPLSPLESSNGRISTELREVHVGYVPSEPGESPPKSADAPSVTDGDRDGNPGATVVLRLFELGRVQLFVVQLLHLRLEGERKSPSRYEGVVRVLAFEQNLLGSEPRLPGLADDLTTRARDGRFTLEKVSPKTTCATL